MPLPWVVCLVIVTNVLMYLFARQREQEAFAIGMREWLRHLKKEDPELFQKLQDRSETPFSQSSKS